MGNIFQVILNSIVRTFVSRGIKSGIDYFNGDRKSRSSLPPATQQPLPDDAEAARRARHAANKARRQGR